ncbi:GH39 family glycosyl hydrolase [Methylobacterium frigidaeris]|uniref:GH39 family glycosyl hydrolase n=1 Tax=Methylobacterium frigidaeris TaxID=2038277 RepID=UPI001EDD364B|nr:glycosyl hydrolase [Methylobacterium frigidaeris]
MTIRADQDAGPNSGFWCATGFSPAELLFLPEMRQTLSFLGSLPGDTRPFVRIHYLLNLVTGMRTATGVAYDWSLLDEALDTLVERGLRPMFELMGNPSNLFTDFDELGQVKSWRDLVTALAARYAARFGRNEVTAWLFETWNEPDLPFWSWGEPGLANYYDACRAGLDAVDPALRLGGPATARTLSSTFRAFLAHCDAGTNILTGAAGGRLDFISVHEKGVRESAEDLTPRPLRMIARELQAVDYVRAHHPRFADLPFVNDEADPQLGWDTPHTWRARPTYAALIAKIADQHRRHLSEARRVDARVVNDNGFLGRWGHRTLFAYFGPRTFPGGQAGHRTDLAAVKATRQASAEPFALVKKPALAVLELMGLLGPRLCSVASDPPLAPDHDGVGMMATTWPGAGEGLSRIAVLVYGSPDRIWSSGEKCLRVGFEGLAPGDYAVAAFRLDDAHGCAFDLWDDWEAPDQLDADQFAALRAAQEAGLLGAVEHVRLESGGSLVREVVVPLPSVTLLLAERRSARLAGAPTNVTAARQPGPSPREDVLLTWRPDPSDRVQLFDVLFGPSAAGPFERVNPVPLLSAAFLHARAPGGGVYHIEARHLDGPPSRSGPLAF